ncbi:hypothetical protein BDB01DRAFT_811888, partial [Pilobolus umbonatus]
MTCYCLKACYLLLIKTLSLLLFTTAYSPSFEVIPSFADQRWIVFCWFKTKHLLLVRRQITHCFLLEYELHLLYNSIPTV